MASPSGGIMTEFILSSSAPIPSLHFLYLALLLLPALLVLLLLPLVLLRKAFSSQLERLNLPPAPRALPVIGHLHLLGSNPHQSLSLLSHSHGPLMFLRFGSIPVLIASSPTMARQILQAHDRTFSFRPQPAIPTQLHGCKNIVFSQPGPYWKLMRQICLTELFGNKRLQSFRPLIAEEVHALLRSVLDTTNQVPLRALLYRATNDMIARMVMGKRLADLGLPSQADPSYNVINLIADAMYLIGIFNVGDFITALAWIDLQGCVRQSKEVGCKLQHVWQEVIDERRETRSRSNNSNSAHKEVDFLDVLMMASESKDATITDFNIMSILTDMFSGGTDTAAISTEWALGELLLNPIKMKKVQEELEQVVGTSRLVQEADIPHLPYLCAIVKETMRLHPVVPLLVPHKASQECQVAGYDIPKDTVAYVNVWAIGRDPSVWERPLEFWPERFLDSSTDVRGQHFELLSFGSGRRICPGLTLGLRSVQLMLASLLHCFEWSSAEKPDMAEKYGIVLKMEKPLVATATPKVASRLLREE